MAWEGRSSSNDGGCIYVCVCVTHPQPADSRPG